MIALLIGVLSGFLNHFINYCIGSPASEKFSPYEIFSFYTVWLAKMRLKKVGLWPQYETIYNDNFHGRQKSKHELITIENDFKKIIYEAADPFFTWERAVGMCPVCTGFWVSLITGLVFLPNFIQIVIIIVVSHITIRILNKIL